MVEPEKEFKDDLMNTTMIEEDDFNPMKDKEELKILLAKDPFASFMEVKGRLTTNGTNEEGRRFIDPQHTTLSHKPRIFSLYLGNNQTTASRNE
ncbi:hypothetical protein CTI12_AA320130 [Artemisia annua]|uniref:Uncharacterized protein n=1 Tax=Artemisia annua TaxID=35608 RepID=A0A2U1N126_ARTAN|nr:hypothetical protein CTI12_AA320130 [Artemisia annua]